MKKILIFYLIFSFYNFMISMEIPQQTKIESKSDLYALIFLNNTNYNIKISYGFDDKFFRRVLAPGAQIIVRNIKKPNFLDFMDYGKYYEQITTQKPIIIDATKKLNVITFDKSPGGYNLSFNEIVKVDKPKSDNPEDIFPALKTRKGTLSSWFFVTDDEKKARYILGLVDNPTIAELGSAYQELLDTYNLNDEKKIKFYGKEFLEKIKNLIEKSYHDLSKNIFEYDKKAKEEIESKEDLANFENLTKEKIYIANYIAQKDPEPVNRYSSDLIEIEPENSANILLPYAGSLVVGTGTKRRVIASNKKEDLADKLNYKEYKDMPKAKIGPLPFYHPRKFYIVKEDKKIEILDKWVYGQKKYEKDHPDFKNKLNKLISEYPHKDENSKVEFGVKIFDEEKEFINKRKELVHKSLEKFLSRKIDPDTTPTIALVFTGGGYRAMVETIGYLRGADQIGLLDCTQYMTGLSGSTWALSAWVSSDKDINSFSKFIRNKINDPSNHIMTKESNLSYSLVEALKNNFDYWPSGIISYFGASLANALLQGSTDDKQQITLSSLAKNLESQKYPLPIFTAINPISNLRWFEFSPYQVGTHQDGGIWIKTPFISRIFENGITKNSAPEYPLSYLMGIWGSAIAISPSEAFSRAPVSVKNAAGLLVPIGSGISKIGEYVTPSFIRIPESVKQYIPSVQSRFAAAQIPNFFYKLNNTPNNQDPLLVMVDGGHDYVNDMYTHNFASVPVLWRKVDVVIMCDANKNEPSGATHLRAAEIRARSLGLDFPQIDFENIDQKSSVLFNQHDGSPIVVYMAGKRNDAFLKGFDPAKETFTNTTNFGYELKNFDKLSGLTQYIMALSKPIIINAINQAIDRKEFDKDSKIKEKLFCPIETENIDKLKEFIDSGENINIQDSKGNTALHYATEKNRIEIVKFLINLPDINLSIKNKNNKTALDIAIEKDHKEIRELILDIYRNALSKLNFELINLSRI